jgi:hypothetical protein
MCGLKLGFLTELRVVVVGLLKLQSILTLRFKAEILIDTGLYFSYRGASDSFLTFSFDIVHLQPLSQIPQLLARGTFV